MNKTTINDDCHIICKCGEDLGVVKSSKGYLCKKCKIVYFTNENSVKLLDKIRKEGKLKTTVLDWLK